MARKVHKLILRKYESIVLENKVAINFDFRSGAKKSGHLDYPLQSYGPKVITPPKKEAVIKKDTATIFRFKHPY